MFHRVMFLFGLTQALECYTCGPEGGKVLHVNNKKDIDDSDSDGDDDERVARYITSILRKILTTVILMR